MADDAAKPSLPPTIVVEPPKEVPPGLELPKDEDLPVPPAPPPSTPVCEEPPALVSETVERLNEETMMVTTADGEPAQATVVEPVEEANAPVDAVLQPAETVPEPVQEEPPSMHIPEATPPEPEPIVEAQPAPEPTIKEPVQAPAEETVPKLEVPKPEMPQVPEPSIEQAKIAIPDVAKDLPVAQITSLLDDLKKRGRKRDKARQNIPGPVFTALLGHQVAPIVKEILNGISKKPELPETKL